MKKTFKVGALAMSLLLTGSTLTACGGGKKVGDDDKRPAIYIQVFEGGYGAEWLRDTIKAYNADNPDNKYKIAIRANKDEFNKVAADIQSGTAIFDMFFSNANVYQLIDGNQLEPLTDVFKSTPDGSADTIEQMLTRSEYVTAYTGRDGELYAIPWQESIKGFVYDHDVFLQYGLLFKEDGTFITSKTDTLSKGKDGVAGTFDDGHPITETQWEAMVAKCKQVLGIPFNYTGKFQSYLNDLYFALLAQYDGVEQYKIHYTFDGQYDMNGDGTPETTITPSSFAALAQAPGKMKALTFMDKYLANKDAKLNIKTPYIFNKAGMLSYSAEDAQNDYILYSAQNKNERIAMLYEGDWWENEADTTFLALEDAGVTSYTWKTRNYKYMTLPNFEGQKTDATHNVFPIGESMYVALKKQKDDTKKTICKDFLTYLYQPRWLQNYSVRCGGIQPYDVALTAEQEAQLSPFAQNTREIYYSANTELISHSLLNNTYATKKAGMPGAEEKRVGYVITSELYYQSAAEFLEQQASDWVQYGDEYYARYTSYIAAGGK